MKFKHIYILIFALLVSCKRDELNVTTDFNSKLISEYIDPYELDSINESWVKEDSLFLSDLKKVLKKDERNIVDIFKIDKKDRKTNLGFGYEQIEASMGKGYVSIFYNVLLKDGQIISYELSPQIPRNKLLTERYLNLYSGIFKIEDNRIYNRYYNIEEMENPLMDIKSDFVLNENLRFLMTPFSGTRYGYYGGEANSIFTNRAIFSKESKSMSSEICQTLMYSKNPSTRLMAFEHYMKNKSEFKNSELIDNWIDKVYSELPTIVTLEGCMVTSRNSKKLVSEYVKRKTNANNVYN
ncbi:hypothetical protein BTO05_01110 [Winogradskyella sp. PC-19]|uniref:hypothetical protein n=1 Tax=Winogradskyella sp. PC-19 TaxID=754417 RepID=UPI000B3C1A1D|nr:hypothetical protein [Winogradskyella sp. PC-19]ARV08306.1 hypothetical protein BTO05_01110 [Winogradskyella sp. PC-19]